MKTSEHVIEWTAEHDEWFTDADGVKYGPGAHYRQVETIREIWTNGSGMFGPADGIDRPIGNVVERREVTIDGARVPHPVALHRSTASVSEAV